MIKDIQYLKHGALSIGVILSEEELVRFSEFFDMVTECNKAFNLTAITEEKDFIDKHIIDSLSGTNEIPLNSSLCDIGAGAGFPSVPIAITRPDLHVTALDSTAKKMGFVQNCAKTLSLHNVQTIVGRAEEQTKLFETFDIVTARAVSALPILLELSIPLLRVGGKFIAYKTDETELASAANALKTLHAVHLSTKLLTLPNGDKRAILVFEKLASTPKQYPRQYGAIKKKPL